MRTQHEWESEIWDMEGRKVAVDQEKPKSPWGSLVAIFFVMVCLTALMALFLRVLVDR